MIPVTRVKGDATIFETQVMSTTIFVTRVRGGGKRKINPKSNL